MIEVLADPGDGSGDFVPVESGKVVVFHEDGTITSNGSLCYMSIDTSESGSGIFSLQDSTITPNDCDNHGVSLYFDVEGSNLIIGYPCIEPCKAKYQKH